MKCTVETTAGGDVELAWYHAFTLRERATLLSLPSDGAPTSDDEAWITRWLTGSRLLTEENLGLRLESIGLSRAGFAALLREPVESIRGRVDEPGWIQELEAALGDDAAITFQLPDSFRQRPEADLIAIAEPLLERAWRQLCADVAAFAPVPTAPLDESFCRSLFGDWPGELLDLLLRVLVVELHRYKNAGLLAGASETDRFHSFVKLLRERSHAHAIWARHPVVARLVVGRLALRRTAAVELARRLIADWEPLRGTFPQLADAHRLVELQPNLGDSHRGGRAVAILTFDSGARLVYKPRPLHGEQHFQDLLAWLNGHGLTAPFRPLRMLVRDDYGWVEHVAAAPCGSAEEVRRFFHRHGGYLALLYAISGADVHCNNVIANGEHPTLVDMESLCTPRLDLADEADRVRWGYAVDSVLHSGLLPCRSFSDAQNPGVDISGMGDPSGAPVTHALPAIDHAGTDRMCIVRRKKERPPGNNGAILDGARHRPEDYLGDIEAGFAEVYDVLLAHRAQLLEEGGPIRRFQEDEVRVVLQPTALYAAMLTESSHPRLTGSALERDCFFDRLVFNAHKAPFLRQIEPAARRALERGDIPVFTCIAGTRHLRAEDDVLVDFFPRSGMDEVRARLARLGDDDRERQLQLVRSALAALRIQGRHHSIVRYEAPRCAPPPTRERLISAARVMGDRLERLASRGGEFASWTALTPDRHEHWTIDAVGVDLYGGLAGIALFLGYLGDVTDEARYRSLANAALQMALRRVAEVDPRERVHGIAGRSGLIYALAHLGVVWDEPRLLDEGAKLAAAVAGAIAPDSECDVLGGLAGDIHAFAALHAARPSAVLARAIHATARAIVARAVPLADGIGWPSSSEGIALAGMAHGVAGIAYALARAATLTADRSLMRASMAALGYERSLFVREEGNWRDLRPNAVQFLGRACGVAWCHGAAGIGLARLATLDLVDDAELRAEVRTAVATTLALELGRNHGLCHGDLGNLELPFTVAERLGDPTLAERVAPRIGAALAAIEADGPMSGGPLGLETPDLMNGIAGTGYALLRFAAPDLVPSVLLLEGSRADFCSSFANPHANRAATRARPATQPARSWQASLAAGMDFLRRAQRRDGSLRDFLLAPGFANAWPTAHAAFVLDDVEGLDELRARAADFLFGVGERDGAWGYNRLVPPDADSTAQALLVLHRQGRPCPRAWTEAIVAAQCPDGGFATYAPHVGPGGASGWRISHPDVTVAVAHLLATIGGHDEALTRARDWMRSQLRDGILPAYWWVTHAYSLWVQAKTRQFTDAVPAHVERLLRERPPSPDLAQLVFAGVVTGAHGIDASVDALVALQHDDGSWPAVPCMRLTGRQVRDCALDAAGDIYPGVSGVFATVHAVAALAARLR